MRVFVTEQGILIPKQWLEGISEVEIRRENNIIMIIPFPKYDPLFALGRDPVALHITDASTQHDRYLIEE